MRRAMEPRKLLKLTGIVIVELAKRGGKARANELRRVVGGTQVYYALKSLIAEGLVTEENSFYVLTSKGWKAFEELQNYITIRVRA